MLARIRARTRRTIGWTRTTTGRLVGHPRAPAFVLAAILVASLGLRLWHIGSPCNAPCKTGSDHGLIFDEAYYVNAARVIDGIHPPPGVSYADAPLHKDPNAEHPQLAKLVIAGGIKVFGDNPWGWRLGSVVFGMIALIALYWLVRGAGGSQWLAVGATAVMATDNLELIHGRIATLDIYVLATVLVSAGFYVRGRSLLAGIVLGIAACMKLIGLGVVPAFVLFDLFAVAWARGVPGAVWAAVRRRALAVGLLLVSAAAVLLAGVWLLDVLLPAYDPGAHKTYAGSPFTHIDHMLAYAAQLKAVSHATGISSPPVGVAVRPARDQLQPHRGQLALRREDRRQPGGVRRPRADQPVHHLHGDPRVPRRGRRGVVRARPGRGARRRLVPGDFPAVRDPVLAVRPDLLPVLHAAGDAGRVPGRPRGCSPPAGCRGRRRSDGRSRSSTASRTSIRSAASPASSRMARVFVTRRLPGPALARLTAAGHEVDVWPERLPPTPAQLRERAARRRAVCSPCSPTASTPS